MRLPLLRATVLGLVLALGPAPTAQEAPRNVLRADFQTGELSTWSVPSSLRERGCTARAAQEGGRKCACLELPADAAEGSMGNLISSVPATELRGQRVRLRAAVRVEGEGHAQLWLRQDGAVPAEFSALVDNMSDRPIRAQDWGEYEIVGDIDARAGQLVFGLMLFGGGRVFLDDVTLDVLGASARFLEPPRALEERGLRNLTAFARLFGYVRHFHPSDEARDAEWDALALSGVRSVEAAGDDASLASALQTWAARVAPSVQVFETKAPPPPHEALRAPAPTSDLRIVRFRHRGFGTGDEASIYGRTRERKRPKEARVPEGWRAPEQTWDAELVPGLSCRVALTLWSGAAGTLPRPAALETPEAASTHVHSGDDRATRLAGIVIAWNVLQHFYPYFDVVDVDWQAELASALSRAALDRDSLAFVETLERLLAPLCDGHGDVSWRGAPQRAGIAVAWAWIEDRLVVTSAPEQSGVARGDVVVSIDGTPTIQAVAALAPRISAATPQWMRLRAQGELALGRIGTKVALELRGADGVSRKVELVRGARGTIVDPRPAPIAELERGLWYVDLSRVDDDTFDARSAELAQARGIVFDLRGYPSLSHVHLGHFTHERLRSPKWLVPTPALPDRRELSFQETHWTVAPAKVHWSAKVAWLTDGQAISAAETYMSLVRAHALGEIVGEPTAGTNGNVNPFTLPGGFEITWTGMKVLASDGSPHHGVGVLPTVPCSRTIAGVRAGRDEQLEKALAIVRD